MDQDSDNIQFLPPDVNHPPSILPLKPLENRYYFIKELGTGSFGNVTLAKTLFDLNRLPQNKSIRRTLLYQSKCFPLNNSVKTQHLVAIKTMISRLPTLHDYKRVREIKFILKMPSNEHLIQIFEIFIDNINFQLHIVMESMEQNLYQMMKHRKRRIFSYPSLKSILAQILAGIKHIHRNNFFHRDIKPENILVSPSSMYFDEKYLNEGNYEDNYVVKLADFGLARDVNNKNPYTSYVSTRWYRSPEILLRNGYYSKPLDIWAFGCVAVEVTTFKPLFPGSDEVDEIWKILEILGTPHKLKENKLLCQIPTGEFWDDSERLAERLHIRFPYIAGISIHSILPNSQLFDLTKVVEKCLKWDPDKRSTAEELCKMDFFEGTVVQRGEYEHINGERPPNGVTNTEQAMIFAGINSKDVPRPNHHLIFNEENVNKETNEEMKKNRCHETNKNELLEEKITLNEFLNDYHTIKTENLHSHYDISPSKGEEAISSKLDDSSRTDDCNSCSSCERADTSDDVDEQENSIDESDLSREFEKSLKYFPIPKEVPNSGFDFELKDLNDEIEVIQKINPNFIPQNYIEPSFENSESNDYGSDEVHDVLMGNEYDMTDDDEDCPNVRCGHYSIETDTTENNDDSNSSSSNNAEGSINSINDFTPRFFLDDNPLMNTIGGFQGNNITHHPSNEQDIDFNSSINKVTHPNQFFGNITF